MSAITTERTDYMGRSKSKYIPTENIDYLAITEAIEDSNWKNYKQLSKVLGWGQNGISNLLRKEHTVSFDRLDQLATLLGYNTSAFIIAEVKQEQRDTARECEAILRAILNEIKLTNTLLADLLKRPEK